MELTPQSSSQFLAWAYTHTEKYANSTSQDRNAQARVVGTRWQNKKRPQERGAGQVLSSTMQRVSECFEHRPLAIEKVRHRELRQDGASVIVPARSTQYQTAEMTGDW